MLRIGVSQRFYDSLGQGINDLQELSKTHDAISRIKTETLHRILTHYLPLYFPRSSASVTTAAATGSSASLSASPRRRASRRWRRTPSSPPPGKWWAARSSIALPVPLDSPAISMFRLMLAEMRSLIRQRDEIEAFAERLLADRPDYQRLQLVPGMGPILP